MKPREIILFSLLFLAGSLFAVNVVMGALTDQHLQFPRFSQILAHQDTPHQISAACTEQDPISYLSESSNPELRKLAEYQTVCHSFVSNQMMVFADMPKDAVDAKN